TSADFQNFSTRTDQPAAKPMKLFSAINPAACPGVEPVRVPILPGFNQGDPLSARACQAISLRLANSSSRPMAKRSDVKFRPRQFVPGGEHVPDANVVENNDRSLSEFDCL